MSDIFSFIKQHVSLLDVASQYVVLKKSHHGHKGCCPFHSEKTPSFAVSPEKGLFYCFGCHVGGDLISFVSRIENCSALQAVDYLAQRYGITIPPELKKTINANQEEPFDEKKKYWHLCAVVAQWCRKNFDTAPANASSYLATRGITPSACQKFGLGYFPSGLGRIKQLIDFVKQEKFLLNNLIQAGIVCEGKSVLYSPYEDRLIFPIKDHFGNICGFGARVIKMDDTRAKYINSKESPCFNKGSLLYGFSEAKNAIQKLNYAFLVEGYTDCIAMVEHGYQATVATLGTAIREEHLTKIARHASLLYVLFDGDKAGQTAVFRLAGMCWAVDLDFKIIRLPTEHDPASYLQVHGTIDPLIDDAQDLFEFIIDTVGKDFLQKNITEKVRVARMVLGVIASVPDHLKKDILLTRASAAFDLPFSSLKRELESPTVHKESTSTNPQATSRTQPENNIKDLLSSISMLEKKLFCAILTNEITHREDELYVQTYMPPFLQEIIKERTNITKEGLKTDLAALIVRLNSEQKMIVSHLIVDMPKMERAEIENLLLQFQKKHWKEYVSQVKKRIAQAKQLGQDVASILLHFQELKQKLSDKGLV